MKKNGKLWGILTFCFILGLAAWFFFVRIAEGKENARQVEKLEAAVASLGEEQLERHWDLVKWYNYQLEQGKMGVLKCYDRILNFGNGQMGLLEVPELNLRRIIYHGTAGEAGHAPDSPLPIGGRGNHTILLLRKWYPWEEGQALYINILDQRLAYRVESVQVMPAGWSTAHPTEAGQDLLTLVFDQEKNRTIIRCVRSTGLSVREKTPISLAYGTIPAFLLGLLGLGRRYAKREQITRISGIYRKNRGKS